MGADFANASLLRGVGVKQFGAAEMKTKTERNSRSVNGARFFQLCEIKCPPDKSGGVVHKLTERHQGAKVSKN